MSVLTHERRPLPEPPTRVLRKKTFIPPTRMLLDPKATYEPFPLAKEIAEARLSNDTLSTSLFGGVYKKPKSIYPSEARENELGEIIDDIFELIENGLPLDLQDPWSQYNFLTAAAAFGHFEVVFKLLEFTGNNKELNPFWMDGNNELALHKLAQNNSKQPNGCISVIERFLDICIQKFKLEMKFPNLTTKELKKQLLQTRCSANNAKVIDYAHLGSNKPLVEYLQRQYGLAVSQIFLNQSRPTIQGKGF
jgi:hypothetical protein